MNLITEIGGYVAADVTALVSEVQRQIASGSVVLYNAEDGNDNDRDRTNKYGPNRNGNSSNSDMKVNPSVLMTDLLMMAFEKAMTVVTPSCLRGLSMQLPEVCMSIGFCLMLLFSGILLLNLHNDAKQPLVDIPT